MMKGISQRGNTYRIDKTHRGVRITGTYQTLEAAQAIRKAREGARGPRG